MTGSRNKASLLFTTFLGLSSLSFSANGHAIDVTFFLYDAGETKALEPVMDALKKADKSYEIMAVGTAESLVKNHDAVRNLVKDCGFSAKITPLEWKREQKLSNEELAQLKKCTRGSILVTGYNSAIQNQLIESVKSKGVETVVFYDSFNPPDTCNPNTSSPCYAHEAAYRADVMLVSTYDLKEAFQNISPVRCFALGNPTLETWKHHMDNVNQQALRTTLQVENDKPVLLYIGGYGDDYEGSFNLFLDSVKNIHDYQIVVTLHPKVDGTLEGKLIADKNLSQIKIAPKDIPTPSIASIASLVVTQRSTAGVQARFAGLPLIYVDVHPQKYTNFLIKSNHATQVSSPEAFIDELAVIQQKSKDTVSLQKKLGIPSNAAEKIAGYLMSILHTPTTPSF